MPWSATSHDRGVAGDRQVTATVVARRRVLDGVAQQVAQRALEIGRVGAGGDGAVGRRHRQRHPGVLGHRAHAFGGAAHELGQVDRRKPQLFLVGVDPR